MTELILLLTAAVIHELGHILCAILFDIPFSGISLRPIGAVMTFDFSGTTYFREGCVHLAGPGFGILSAALAILLFGDAAIYFAGLSVSLAGMNLLPIQGFDGGGVLSCLLSAIFPPDRACSIGRAVSILTTVLLWIAVLWIELRAQASAALILFVLYVMIFYAEAVNFR